MELQTLKAALVFVLWLTLFFCGSQQARSELCPPYEWQDDVVEGVGNTTSGGSNVKITDDTSKSGPPGQSYFDGDTSTEVVRESTSGQSQPTSSGSIHSSPPSGSYFGGESRTERVEQPTSSSGAIVPVYVPTGPSNIIKPWNTGLLTPGIRPTHVHRQPTHVHRQPTHVHRQPTHVHVKPTRGLPTQPVRIDTSLSQPLGPPVTGVRPQSTSAGGKPPQTMGPWVIFNPARNTRGEIIQTPEQAGYRPDRGWGALGTTQRSGSVGTRKNVGSVKTSSPPIRRVQTPVKNRQTIRRTQSQPIRRTQSQPIRRTQPQPQRRIR